jgi:hypothetical protein
MITTGFVATDLGRIDRSCTFVMENFGQCRTPTGMYDMVGRHIFILVKGRLEVLFEHIGPWMIYMWQRLAALGSRADASVLLFLKSAAFISYTGH